MSIRKEQKQGSAIFYLVDEEKRTVTAKIPVRNMIEGIYNDCGKRCIPPYKVYEIEKDYPHRYFIGTAKCSPEDTFDVEIGKQIAAARMFQKYYRTKLNAMRRIADELDGLLESCEDLMNYSWLAVDKNIKKEINLIFDEKKD